jgi:hypothetical protein
MVVCPLASRGLEHLTSYHSVARSPSVFSTAGAGKILAQAIALALHHLDPNHVVYPFLLRPPMIEEKIQQKIHGKGGNL